MERRVTSGQWKRCGRGVYFVDDRPFTDAARIRAAVWGYGARAAASGMTAAWWHGLTQFAPAVVEVTTPRNSHGRRHPGTRVRRRDLEPVDVVVVNDMRVTALALTVVEASAKRGGGAKLMDNALQRHTDINSLWRAHLRNKGRTGAPRSRMLLQAAGGGARSEAERLLHQILRSANITGWKANYRVGGYRVDVGFPGPKSRSKSTDSHFTAGRRVSDRSRTSERHRATGLAGAALHLAGPDRVPGEGRGGHPLGDFGALIDRQRRKARPIRRSGFTKYAICV